MGGGIGLNCIQDAKIAEATTIIAVDIVESKLKTALSLGATHSINSAKENPNEVILSLTEGKGVHYAFEAIGTQDTPFQQSIECTRRRGTTVWVGAAPDNLKIPLDARFLFFEKRIMGSYLGSIKPKQDISMLISMYKNHMIELDQLVSKEIDLEEINQAFKSFETGNSLRNVISFN